VDFFISFSFLFLFVVVVVAAAVELLFLFFSSFYQESTSKTPAVFVDVENYHVLKLSISFNLTFSNLFAFSF